TQRGNGGRGLREREARRRHDREEREHDSSSTPVNAPTRFPRHLGTTRQEGAHRDNSVMQTPLTDLCRSTDELVRFVSADRLAQSKIQASIMWDRPALSATAIVFRFLTNVWPRAAKTEQCHAVVTHATF